MSGKVTLARAVLLCAACPSAWNAWDSDGNYWYLRYRHGHGTARQYDGPDWHDNWSPGAKPHRVISFSHGHPLDGIITLEEFAGLSGFALSPGLDYDPPGTPDYSGFHLGPFEDDQ